MTIEIKREAGNTILTAEKIDFKTKATVTDKEGCYTMIKGAIQQKGITLVNIYASYTGAPKYLKQISMYIDGETNRNTVLVEDFSHPIDINGRSFQIENQLGKDSLT